MEKEQGVSADAAAGGEALIVDAHLPSMTARFRIPPGLPFAAGLYRLEYLRRPTDEDRQLWAHLPDSPDEMAVQEALERMIDAFENKPLTAWQQEVVEDAREALRGAS